LYAARFPRYFDLVLRAGEAPEAVTGLASLRFYRVLPTRVKILDEQEFGEASLGLSVATCARPATPPEVRVQGVDYAFVAPDTLAPGETIFAFENAGGVLHEVKVIGLNDGVTLADIMRLEHADSGWRHLTDQTSGILI
jgi:hypothetical protein